MVKDNEGNTKGDYARLTRIVKKAMNKGLMGIDMKRALKDQDKLSKPKKTMLPKDWGKLKDTLKEYRCKGCDVLPGEKHKDDCSWWLKTQVKPKKTIDSPHKAEHYSDNTIWCTVCKKWIQGRRVT